MSEKTIKIKAVLDTQGFDNQISSLQTKLKQMQSTSEGLTQAKSQFGSDSLMGRYAAAAFGDFSKDSKKDLEAMFQSQRREALNQSINLKAKQQELDKLAKIEGQMTAQQQQRVTLLEKELTLLKERNRSTLQAASQTKQILGEVSQQEDASGQGGQGDAPTKSPNGFFKSLLQGIGLSQIIKGALNAATHSVERDRKILTNQGAAANIVSKEMRQEFAGKGSEGIFYAPQRQKAMAMAAKEQRGQGMLDFGQIGKNMAAGAAAGFGIGAMGFNPLTMAGGAIAGAGVGLLGSMGSDKLRSRVFDQEQYQSILTKEGLSKYEANYAAQQALDPKRQMAFQRLQQISPQMGQTQRELGMTTDNALIGNEAGNTLNRLNAISNVPLSKPYSLNLDSTNMHGQAFGRKEFDPTGKSPLKGGIQADTLMDELLSKPEKDTKGYLIDQMEGGTGSPQYDLANINSKRKAILAGGGATEAQGLASTAAKFERNTNMLNAGSVFGKIAGAGMGTETNQTEDAVKRLLAEGVKMGVDASDMPQEMKRFTTAAAQIMTQGGGLSETAVSRLGDSMGGTSAIEVEAGKSAYQDARNAAKEAAGIKGQIGYGFMGSDEAKTMLGGKAFNKLSKNSGLLNELNQLSVEDLEKDPARLKGIARRLGISEEKLKEFIGQKSAKKQTFLSGTEDLLDTYRSKTKDMELKEKDAFDLSDEGSELYSKAMTGLGREVPGFNQMTPAKQKATLRARASFQGGYEATSSEQFDPILKSLGKKALPSDLIGPMASLNADLNTSPNTAAVADEQSRARGDILKTQELQKHVEDFTKASKASAEGLGLTNEQFLILTKSLKDLNSSKVLGGLATQLQTLSDNLTNGGVFSTEPSSGGTE